MVPCIVTVTHPNIFDGKRRGSRPGHHPSYERNVPVGGTHQPLSTDFHQRVHRLISKFEFDIPRPVERSQPVQPCVGEADVENAGATVVVLHSVGIEPFVPDFPSHFRDQLVERRYGIGELLGELLHFFVDVVSNVSISLLQDERFYAVEDEGPDRIHDTFMKK